MRNASFKLMLCGCEVSVCCVDFASFDVVCDELYDNACNVCLCSSVTVEYCVLYPCCVGVFDMFAVM